MNSTSTEIPFTDTWHTKIVARHWGYNSTALADKINGALNLSQLWLDTLNFTLIFFLNPLPSKIHSFRNSLQETRWIVNVKVYQVCPYGLR